MNFIKSVTYIHSQGYIHPTDKTPRVFASGEPCLENVCIFFLPVLNDQIGIFVML